MMRICYINLDRATLRRQQMETEADRLGLAFERFPAVSADAVDEATVGALDRRWERPLSKAELACFLSHRTLWQRVAETGQPMLILEDDVRLSPRLASLCAASAWQESADMDLLNLEDFGRRRFLAPAPRPLAGDLQRLRVFRDKAGAAAYVLWPAGAQKLLARAERQGAAPADAFIHACGELVSWQCQPALAIQAEVLARRDPMRGDVPPTSIQVPRRRLRPVPRHWRFFARRAAAQVRLLPHHLSRLGGVAYREVRVDSADFSADAHSRS
jgi:glycosyl transferase family 25